MRVDAGEITANDLVLDNQNSLVVRYFEDTSVDLPDIYPGASLPGDRYITLGSPSSHSGYHQRAVRYS